MKDKLLTVISGGNFFPSKRGDFMRVVLPTRIPSQLFCKRILRKRCSENMQQVYRRTPMPKCDFDKVVLQLY